MKYKILYEILFAALGSVVGCFIGIKDNLYGWELFREAMYGVAVFLSIGNSFLENKDKFGILIGVITGLLVSVSADLLAGSQVVVTDKLVYMMLGSFVGWGASWGKAYWAPVFIGGILGGAVGFFIGFKRGHWFGQAYLEPGFLNAVLTFPQLFMVGMGIVSLFLKSLGWRLIENRISGRLKRN